MQPTIPTFAAALIGRLDDLTERATEAELSQWLQALELDASDLEPFIKFHPKQYRRNLISEGRWYELLAICWQSGQRSPIHDHAQSTCGLRVITGTMTETLFESTPCGQIKAVSSRDMEAGQTASSADADIHQVSNLKGEGNPLVTLHIYSPPLRSMSTYSLTGAERGLYEPTYVYEDGGGI